MRRVSCLFDVEVFNEIPFFWNNLMNHGVFIHQTEQDFQFPECWIIFAGFIDNHLQVVEFDIDKPHPCKFITQRPCCTITLDVGITDGRKMFIRPSLIYILECDFCSIHIIRICIELRKCGQCLFTGRVISDDRI